MREGGVAYIKIRFIGFEDCGTTTNWVTMPRGDTPMLVAVYGSPFFKHLRFEPSNVYCHLDNNLSGCDVRMSRSLVDELQDIINHGCMRGRGRGCDIALVCLV